jgi:hypothetical protein
VKKWSNTGFLVRAYLSLHFSFPFCKTQLTQRV